MAELIVVGFKNDMLRATRVLNELQRLDDDSLVDLHDAVAVYRDRNGSLRTDKRYHVGKGEDVAEGGAWGGLLGFIIGATLAIPLTAGASGVAAASAVAAGALGGTAVGVGAGALDAASWKDSLSISRDFVREIGDLVQPGDSAIYAILSVADPGAVADRLRGYGGKILRTTLSTDQQEKVAAVLHQ